MTTTSQYPKRLIEVDLPIRRISAHARREKSIRRGHISTLHIWWARRPLAACRAVICAALWPDPADPLCPDAFRAFAREQMQLWANTNRHLASKESMPRIELARENPAWLDDPEHVRLALLDFIADFANWDNSTRTQYLETTRALTQAAHEALGGEPGTRPLMVDPFAGGGAIPLEALRVGADAFASDLNPVAVLLNKVVLEYIPTYGQRLADEVRKWGKWIQQQAEQEMAEFYPKDPDGTTPIAYLWARTIRCEGPGCGAQVPLIHSLWLAKRSKNAVALLLIPNHAETKIVIKIVDGVAAKDVGEGTIRKGSAICPICGFTTRNENIRSQLTARLGGTRDALLIAVVMERSGGKGRSYREPNSRDRLIAQHAAAELDRRIRKHEGSLSLLPDEPIPPKRPSPNARGVSAITRMGIKQYGDIFTPRQALALVTLSRLIDKAGDQLFTAYDNSFATAVQACLAIVLSRVADRSSSLCRYDPSPTMSGLNNTFARQALPIVWDFGEGNPVSTRSGGWGQCLEWVEMVLQREAGGLGWSGIASQQNAADLALPDDVCQAIITDPPYYDAVPYADLSDFFYIWLRRTLRGTLPDMFTSAMTPKDEEAIWNPTRIYPPSGEPKDQAFYERQMTKALRECNRITDPNGIGTIVFAHKSTAGWEAILTALINAKWSAVASWPIDTEMGTRVNAQGTASLASSIHIVCRPRRESAGIGNWRDVLAELPSRIHDWMPRLVAEGVVGADAIFACLGPAVEIFSRYERVEKASGEVVTLRDYLPHVWAAVSREALRSILEGDEASELEDDARLTAIWFWVLKATPDTGDAFGTTQEEELTDDDVDAGDEDVASSNRARAKTNGYAMEYDAARKLAQGLGVDLSKLSRPGGIISIHGKVVTLHQATSRERFLLGAQLSLFDGESPIFVGHSQRRWQPELAKYKSIQAIQPRLIPESDPLPTNSDQPQLPLFEDIADQRTFLQRILDSGETMLDRLHQAMLLFGRGQTALLGQFLTEAGMGSNPNFWRLAQALSALYPLGSDEKRWVDGVLARKKGWGM